MARKIVKNSETGEVFRLWQIWSIAGVAVVTIPAELVHFISEGPDGRKWMVVEEGSAMGFNLRALTKKEIVDIDWREP